MQADALLSTSGRSLQVNGILGAAIIDPRCVLHRIIQSLRECKGHPRQPVGGTVSSLLRHGRVWPVLAAGDFLIHFLHNIRIASHSTSHFIIALSYNTAQSPLKHVCFSSFHRRLLIHRSCQISDIHINNLLTPSRRGDNTPSSQFFPLPGARDTVLREDFQSLLHEPN